MPTRNNNLDNRGDFHDLLYGEGLNPEVDKFWMIVGLNTNCSIPKFMHSTKELAEVEAIRLAKANPGISFVVLESIKKVVTTSPVDVTDYK